MEMTGEYRIRAPRKAVWDALNDTEILKRCLRGCEHLERIDDRRMVGTMTTKVGPVKATVNGEITLSDVDPPNGYRIAGAGMAGAAGYVKGGASVALSDDAGDTLLAYVVDATLSGKLAQIGSRVIDAAAKKMADDFFKRFSEDVSQAAPGQMAADRGPVSAGSGTDGQRPPGGIGRWWLIVGAVTAAIVLAFVLSQ